MGFVDGEGENAIEPLDAALSPLHVGFQHHFGVGMALKVVPCPDQVISHFVGVVNFPVVDQTKLLSASHRRHGLEAVFQINDTEPVMEEDGVFVAIAPALVRPPPGKAELHL